MERERKEGEVVDEGERERGERKRGGKGERGKEERGERERGGKRKWEGKREEERRTAIATCHKQVSSHLLTSFLISLVRNREYSILFIKLFSNDS